jgi:hypothetical protein
MSDSQRWRVRETIQNAKPCPKDIADCMVLLDTIELQPGETCAEDNTDTIPPLYLGWRCFNFATIRTELSI